MIPNEQNRKEKDKNNYKERYYCVFSKLSKLQDQDIK